MRHAQINYFIDRAIFVLDDFCSFVTSMCIMKIKACVFLKTLLWIVMVDCVCVCDGELFTISLYKQPTTITFGENLTMRIVLVILKGFMSRHSFHHLFHFQVSQKVNPINTGLLKG